MGTESRFTGEIRITPPIPWPQVKDTPFNPMSPEVNRWNVDVKFETENITVDTEDGQLIRRRAVAIVPLTAERYKGYDILSHLGSIAAVYGAQHTFSGYIERQAETGELMRYAIVGGVAREYEPEIVWPEEVR